MLAPGKVAGKVVAIPAAVAADVALEWVLIAVAAHVDGKEDVVREVDVAVRAVLQHLRVLLQGRGTWLTSDAAGRAGSLAAGTHAGAAAAVGGRSGIRAHGGRGLGHAGRHGPRSPRRLLHQEGRLLVRQRLSPGRLRGAMGVGRQTGQLAGQRGELVERVVHRQVMRLTVHARLPAATAVRGLHLVQAVVGVLVQAGVGRQLVAKVGQVVLLDGGLLHDHGGGAEVDEQAAAVAQ